MSGWNSQTGQRIKDYPSLNSPAFTTATLRSIKKKTSRKFWIVIFLLLSVLVLIVFPPQATLYIWTTRSVRSNFNPQWDFSPSSNSVYDGTRDWDIEWDVDLSNHYGPKTKQQFDKAMDRIEEEEGKLFPEFSRPSISQSLQNSPLFQRLQVKEAPTELYKPLPKIRLEPDSLYEDVRPSLHRLTKDAENAKFVTYAPHSGFHNQRIELINAFKIAKMLNRTLLLPYFRLGRPQGWSGNLVKNLQEEEMNHERFRDECLASMSGSASTMDKQSEECKDFSSWTSVQVDYIMKIGELSKEVPIVDRTDLRESWLWHTLKLSPGEWLEFKDDARYNYQIYESSAMPDTHSGTKYHWRLNIDDLAALSDVRLLSFGSVFGSGRVLLSSQEMIAWKQKINDNQLLNLPLLEKISDEMAEQLGGRGKYIGIHLRMRDPIFQKQAPQVIRSIFHEVCEKLKLNKKIINKLITQHQTTSRKKTSSQHKHKNQANVESRGIQATDDFENNDGHLKHFADSSNDRIKKPKHDSSAMNSEEAIELSPHLPRKSSVKTTIIGTPKPGLECKKKLYNSKPSADLKKLNTPIYIATDVSAHSIQSNPDLSLLLDTFPCVFLFDDLKKLNQVSGPSSRASYKRKSYPRSILQESQGREHSRNKNMKFASVEEDQDAKDHFAHFHKIKSNVDGLNLDKFLLPFLEAMIVSKGSEMIGTPGSTFSDYLIRILHPNYSSNKA